MTEPEYKKWYKTALWQNLRKIQLLNFPFCVRCLKDHGEYVVANVVNHIIPHKGNWDLFNNPDNLESVCKHCHDSVIQSEEKRGYSKQVGVDGWPEDEKHPINRKV